MDKNMLTNELRWIANGRVSSSLCNLEGANDLLDVFLDNLSLATGISRDQIIEQLCVKEGIMQKCTTSDGDVQNCTKTLGYGKSLPEDVYAEIDKLLKEGFSNKVVSEKTGVHRNTISKRRIRLGL
jgi:hypothetical protein